MDINYEYNYIRVDWVVPGFYTYGTGLGGPCIHIYGGPLPPTYIYIEELYPTHLLEEGD